MAKKNEKLVVELVVLMLLSTAFRFVNMWLGFEALCAIAFAMIITNLNIYGRGDDGGEGK